jgi:hypothetical protein
MPNWIAITKADLYNSKVAALIDASNTASLGAGQADRTTGVIADVTLEIRRKVAKCNVLDVDATKIPGGLKTLAVDLIFCRLKTALEIELNDDERQLLRRRETDLDRIADGKDLIDPPDNAVAANFVPSNPSPSFGSRGIEMPPRKFNDTTQDG